MRKTNLQKLMIALSNLDNNKTLELGNDTFLTGYLDGSEKIYGWKRVDGDLFVINSNSDYPIEDMDKADITYIFGLSASKIYKKIINNEYEIDDSCPL